MADEVLFEVADHVATITLNRPDAMNAINPDLSAALREAYRRVDADDDIRVAILTGNGRAFCAGADLRGGSPGSRGAAPGDVFSGPPAELTRASDMRKPVIAAVNGYCLGGGFEMALHCDLLIASEAAQFGLPEITLGFYPLAGAPIRLPRSIPRAFANEMLFLGQRIDAATALRYGIVSRVVPADQLLDEARAMASTVAGYAPVAVRAMKEITYAQDDLTAPQAARLDTVLRWIVGRTDDSKEGARAFVEKRAPAFRGE
ncbi:MAG: enoyl-CoA hydratase/isomerase family protein [Dehalococcoidia bacterium]|nr:enoyl-CoA hydratase/isomerase family protein [Dehalococcoidia bacterium]